MPTEKILDVLKERFKSPFLSNYFIGVLLFNRKVLYAALFLDHNDRINNLYYYDGISFDNRIDLLTDIYFSGEDYLFCISWLPWNLLLWPLIYSVIITGVAPYLKSVFKTISENADLFYDRLRIFFNGLKTVTLEKYQKLEVDYFGSLKKIETLKTENDGLTKEKSEFDEIKKQLEIDKIQLTEKKNLAETEIDLQGKRYESEIQKHRLKIANMIPTIGSLFRTQWKIEFDIYELDGSLSKESGSEEFTIFKENYEEIKPTGRRELTFKISNYEYIKNNFDLLENSGDVIKFDKVSPLNCQDVFANCEWAFVNDSKLTGNEYQVKSKRQVIVRVEKS